jgi:hypothetical protein
MVSRFPILPARKRSWTIKGKPVWDNFDGPFTDDDILPATA